MHFICIQTGMICVKMRMKCFTWLILFMFAVFKELQKESEFQRKEWFRKQGKTGWAAQFGNKIAKQKKTTTKKCNY